MMRRNRKNNQGAWLWIAVLALVLIAACDDDKDDQDAILLAADPPSLIQGERIESTIKSNGPFFAGKLNKPITSEGGLTLTSLTITNDKTARAVISSNDNTTIGAHSFELEMDGTSAELTISVIAPEFGQGTIRAEGTTATAGANMATLTIFGQGTSFDKKCTVQAEGADGFEVDFVDVITANALQVNYSISLDQEATQATVVLQDGGYRYEVPFTILSPSTFENQATDQVLTRGQVGWVTLSHAEASLGPATFFKLEDESVESGSADVLQASKEVRIPVRVPIDFNGNSLNLTAWSYSQGGAIFETMTVEVELVEPGYFALVPSRLEKTPSEQTVDIVAHEIDLTGLKTLVSEENDTLTLLDWEAAAPGSGNVELLLDSEIRVGAYKLIADNGVRQLTSLVAVTGAIKQNAVYAAEKELIAGDHVYLPIVARGIDLLEGSTELEGDESVEVIGITHIDPGSIIAELAVDGDAEEGMHTLVLNNGSETYDVYIKINDSGL